MIGWHPWNCRRDPHLHRQLFICADDLDILLVRMDWDGNISRDPAELVKLGPQADVKTQRCPVSEAAAYLNAIVNEKTA